MSALEILLQALSLFPVLVEVVGAIIAARNDGKVTAPEAIRIAVLGLTQIGQKLAALLPGKAGATVGKVVALLPILADVAVEIEQAQAGDSPGGRKLTPPEVVKIATNGAEKVAKAVRDLFAA